MKINRIISPVLIALIAALSSCSKPDESVNDGKDINVRFSFTLKMSEISYDSAKISVKHDGPEDATWYGFVTTDLKKNNFDLFYDKYTELQAAGTVSGLKQTNNRTITLTDLEAETKYKYVVFAITEDGRLYENVEMKTIEFTTGANIYRLEKTDNWKMSYLGRDPESGKEIFNVESAGGLFVWDYISKESIKAFDTQYPDGYDIVDENDTYMATVNGIEMFVLQQIANIQAYVSMGEDITTMTYDSGGQFEVPRLMSDEYYLVAFGFYKNGQHTQTYSISDFSIAEETATPEYLKWCGTYRFTGKVNTAKAGEKENLVDRSYDIIIEHVDNNFMYRVRGWECGESVENDWEVDIMQLDKSKGEYIGFPGYFNNGNFELRETGITQITFDGVTTYTLGMYGYALDAKGVYSPPLFDGNPMASAAPIAEGATSTQLEGLDAKYGTTEWTYSRIGYVAWESINYSYMSLNPEMHLPITIEKISDTVPASMKSTLAVPVIEATRDPFGTTAAKERPVTFSRR